MTAYQLTPVGASGPEPDRAVRIEMRSYTELAIENRRLREQLHRAVRAAEAVARITARYEAEAERRIETQIRLNRAMRVLTAFERSSPALRRRVAEARDEIWRLDGGT